MRALVTTGFVASALLTSGAVAAKSIEEQLMMLSPETRAEQRCNERATGELHREHKLATPDEVVAYAFADVSVSGTRLDAPGAAVRSRGAWYKLSYHCQTSDDGLRIVSFDYALGAEVPRDQWDAHDLVP